MSTDPGHARGAPPEPQDATIPHSAHHHSDAGDSEPPHGDPLRRKVAPDDHDPGPPDSGTRHGADPQSDGRSD